MLGFHKPLEGAQVGFSAPKKAISISSPFPQKSEPLLYGEPNACSWLVTGATGGSSASHLTLQHILLLSNSSNI